MHPTPLLQRGVLSSLVTTMASSRLAEGVFAINKPPSLSSAQVIRDAQSAFQHSKLFQPWLEREKQRLEELSHNQKQKRRSWKSRQPTQVKMGHGGTLDPMATGVLILGVGSGTKSLHSFLECTKSYECVVLFGAATDSYDAVGKVVARKDYAHVTRERVEKALGQFRGKIRQKPPIFSALKIDGKKMYEYAREGKELPKEIEARPVEVKELEVVEWMEGGAHEHQWPTDEAPTQEREVVDKVLGLEHQGADTGVGAKRKRDPADDHIGTKDDPSARKRAKSSPEPTMSGALPSDATDSETTAVGDAPLTPSSSEPVQPCPAPAVRLRMTVTSGFYVRSLAHDLGASLDSLGLMSSLVRTRQGDFALGDNVLDYEDLGKGEEVWGEKVQRMLGAWEEKERAREVPSHDGNGAGSGTRNGGSGHDDSESKLRVDRGKKGGVETDGWRTSSSKRRKNSSSSDSGD